MAASSDDPFDRLAKSKGDGPAPARPEKPAADHVAPIPRGAPPRLETHRDHGKPATWWTYRSAGGEPLGYVARFDKPDGSKVVLPLTLWRSAERLQWRWKAFPEPRPLYGLHGLAQRPNSTVLVVEGEKAADAAQDHFSELAVVTWPGGSKATAKTDWRPLAGRQLVVWPDADEPGAHAAREVVRMATTAGALTAAVVKIPAALPEGWDLADGWPSNFGVAEARALITAADDGANPVGVVWPAGFRMEPTGLYYDQPVKDGGCVPHWLSAPFEVLAEARDRDGEGWASVVRFKDRDGRQKTLPVLRSRLAAGGAEVRGELADAGLVIPPAPGKASKFITALALVGCARRMTLVGATGWNGSRYVLPSGVIGAPGSEEVLFTGDAPALHYRQKGTLEGWRNDLAALAVGNDLLTFALSTAFLGPLLRPLEVEGGGVHFRGGSSIGKSTLGEAAGSVWGGGGPLGFAHSWRTTANALEMLAWGHNDGLLVLDELALVAPEEAGSAAYMLASGQSKARARADGSLRRRSEWRVAFISTGEISLSDHMRASRRGDRAMSGQELRLLDVPADAGFKMGIWETLHGRPGPAELTEGLKAASGRNFGYAGPAFVERVALARAAAIADAKVVLGLFLEEASEAGDSGQAHRAAVRFGAIAAAGELAANFGIVPWKSGWASEVALRLYRRWAGAFGRDAPHEERSMLRRLKAVIESEEAMFSRVSGDDIGEDSTPSAGGRDGEARALKTYGYRAVRNGETTWLFHSEGWSYVFSSFNPQEAARVVATAGYLERDENDTHLTRRFMIRGARRRLYAVKGSILEADFGD